MRTGWHLFPVSRSPGGPLRATNIDGKADNVRHRKNSRLAPVATLALVGGQPRPGDGQPRPRPMPWHPTSTINLVGINDFHGRIDANTVKWAGTVETDRGGRRACADAAIIGAGDLDRRLAVRLGGRRTTSRPST